MSEPKKKSWIADNLSLSATVALVAVVCAAAPNPWIAALAGGAICVVVPGAPWLVKKMFAKKAEGEGPPTSEATK